MKKTTLLFLLGLLTVECITHRANADLTITDQGKSTFSILVPEKAPDSVTAATQELQRDILNQPAPNW